MLDGLEITELSLEQILQDNKVFRFDAEYFSKYYLNRLQQLENVGYSEIGKFAFVTDGIHTAIDYSENSNIKLISATSPRDNFFDLSRQVYISEKAHKANPRTALKENDIIISTVGTIGNCAVVTKSILPANSDRHVGIVRIEKNFLPLYLSTFLVSKYGRFQTIRESTGNVQLNLFLVKIRTLKVPTLSYEFQERISEIVSKAHNLAEESKFKYNQAEMLFLSELDLNDFKSTEENTSVRTIEDIFSGSWRLDAEYYQPKYDELEKAIEGFVNYPLRNLVHIKKSIETGSDAYSDEGVPYVRVSDISKFGIDEPNIRISSNYFSKKNKNLNDLKIKKDTILLTKDGSIGIAYVADENLDMITSGALLHLTINNKNILPEYLALVLNSLVVQLQAERDSGGSIIIHWRVSEIENVIIPILDMEYQTKISDFIKISKTKRTQSKQLLDLAKSAVEIAIEENEEKGIKLINDYLNRQHT